MIDPGSARVNGGGRPGEGAGGLAGAYFLSFFIGAFILWLLINDTGRWYVLANTRVLDLLIRAGVVRVHDAGAGFVEGVPDHTIYLKSQDPIDMGILAAAVGLLVAVWLIKAVQLHGIARFVGIAGSLGQHARAHLYGLGVGRVLPFQAGEVATASALMAQGAPRGRAALAVFIADLFILFEIVVFALIGLLLMNWAMWLAQLFWCLVILGAAYLFMRPSLRTPALQVAAPRPFRVARQAIGAFAHQPRLLMKLAGLSLLAFALQDVAAYLIVMAYSSQHVILHVPAEVLLMGVVGSYIARLIQVTPGGIGQGEWGMALVLYVGGVDMSAAGSVALLVGFFRYLSIMIVFAAVAFGYGIETNLRRVLETFRGADLRLPPDEAPVAAASV